MNATVLDLRYKMKKVLAALDNRESVQVLYHGKVKGVIVPVGAPRMKTADHAYFGSVKSNVKVEKFMKELRGGRYRDL